MNGLFPPTSIAPHRAFVIWFVANLFNQYGCGGLERNLSFPHFLLACKWISGYDVWRLTQVFNRIFVSIQKWVWYLRGKLRRGLVKWHTDSSNTSLDTWRDKANTSLLQILHVWKRDPSSVAPPDIVCDVSFLLAGWLGGDHIFH